MRARRARLQVERGQERGAGNAPLGIRLVHPGDGGAQVVVGALRLVNEGIEVRRSEGMPPEAAPSRRLGQREFVQRRHGGSPNKGPVLERHSLDRPMPWARTDDDVWPASAAD